MKERTVESFEDIYASDRVRSYIRNLAGMTKPKVAIQKVLMRMQVLYKYNTDVLEKYLAFFSAWQNFYGEQVVIADVISTVAESQKAYFFSRAVSKARGSINEKKEHARSDIHYIAAEDVAVEAKAFYDVMLTNFENCDRGFRLVSRILAKRLSIKEF